jgi:hypothetical protein
MSDSVFTTLSTMKALLQQIIFISSRTVLLVWSPIFPSPFYNAVFLCTINLIYKLHKLRVDNLCTLLVTLSVQHNIYKFPNCSQSLLCSPCCCTLFFKDAVYPSTYLCIFQAVCSLKFSKPRLCIRFLFTPSLFYVTPISSFMVALLQIMKLLVF